MDELLLSIQMDNPDWNWLSIGRDKTEKCCATQKNDKDGILLQYCESIDEITYLVPSMKMVGLGGFELPTSPLSGVCSNHLSYRPLTYTYSETLKEEK